MNVSRLLPLTLLSITLFLSSASAGERSYRLSEDASLPAGKNHVVLKAGTTATVNDRGHAVSGILAKDDFVSTARIALRFKSGTEIVLDDSGHVRRGTIANNETIYNGRNFYRYSAGTLAVFDERGNITEGTLLTSQMIDTGRLRCLMQADKIYFQQSGLAAGGTLAADQALSNGRVSFVYKSGTPVTFNAYGYLKSGVLLNAQNIATKHTVKTFPSGSRVNFTDDGYAL